MFAKVVTIVALGGLALLAAIMAQARYQQRKVERMLSNLDQLHTRNVAAKEKRDRRLLADKALLDAALAELRTAVAEANAVLDQRLRETRDLFAKKRILNDKMKLLKIQRPGPEASSTGSMTALADEFRARAEEVRRLARRF